MGLDVGQHRLHVFFVVRTVAVHGLDVVVRFAVAGRIGEDQRVQPAGTVLFPRELCGDLGDGPHVGLV